MYINGGASFLRLEKNRGATEEAGNPHLSRPEISRNRPPGLTSKDSLARLQRGLSRRGIFDISDNIEWAASLAWYYCCCHMVWRSNRGLKCGGHTAEMLCKHLAAYWWREAAASLVMPNNGNLYTARKC